MFWLPIYVHMFISNEEHFKKICIPKAWALHIHVHFRNICIHSHKISGRSHINKTNELRTALVQVGMEASELSPLSSTIFFSSMAPNVLSQTTSDSTLQCHKATPVMNCFFKVSKKLHLRASTLTVVFWLLVHLLFVRFWLSGLLCLKSNGISRWKFQAWIWKYRRDAQETDQGWKHIWKYTSHLLLEAMWRNETAMESVQRLRSEFWTTLLVQ